MGLPYTYIDPPGTTPIFLGSPMAVPWSVWVMDGHAEWFGHVGNMLNAIDPYPHGSLWIRVPGLWCEPAQWALLRGDAPSL